MRKLMFFSAVLFLFSCGENGQAKKQSDDPLADRFKPIEGKLAVFAKGHKAKLSTVWSKLQLYGPERSDSFLSRHIVWTEGRFGKAVLIGQYSDHEGVDTAAWNVSNLAWLEDTQLSAKPTYIDHLLIRVDFHTIEKNIDRLLRTSEENLHDVRVEQLK